MASDLIRWLALFGVAAGLILSAATPSLRAATGDPLLEFNSALGTTPESQGWTHEGRSLNTECPKSRGYNLCWFQGSQDLNDDSWPDNDCGPGKGCHTNTEHYNSPNWMAGPTGATTYTEWIGFDSGSNDYRPLVIPDSTIAHSPPWGAPFFTNAPVHPVLRVVTGDGNNVAGTLPGPNDRNSGMAKIRKAFPPGTAGAFTLLAKVAAGPRAANRPFVEIRAFNRRFAFGVDGAAGSPTYGKITVVAANGESGTVVGTLFDRTVMVTQPGAAGPHAGEFFTFRVAVRSDGTFRAYLNEDTVAYASGWFGSSSPAPSNEVHLTPMPGDDTMWFDSVELLEGELPALCADPAVDTNRDGYVNDLDLMAFLACTNGPGIPTLGTFECTCLDADQDTDVDMVDFAVFQRCLTSGTQLDPACDD
jgi:hypothetical protein